MGTRSRGRSEASVPNDERRVRAGAVAGLGASRGQCRVSCSILGRCWEVHSECRRRRFWSSRIAEVFTPYHDLVDLGYSYRYYAEPPPTPVVTATLEFGDGRPEETVRLPGLRGGGPADASSAAVGLGECAFHGCAGGQGADRRLEQEPAGACLRTSSLFDPARLPERDAPSSASSDSRAGTGARGDPVARRRRGSTCSPSRCSPRPSGSEITRATAFRMRRQPTWAISGVPRCGAGTRSSSPPRTRLPWV